MTIPSVIERRCGLLQESQRGCADLIIIGGGIHGCAAAREAALQGLSVILFEAEDIGSGTSSRSSKMLHGGVRYLEQGDVSLVFEALRERAVLLNIAAPFARSQRFLFPVIPGKTKSAWQIRIGLLLYDILAALGHSENPLRGHREVSAESSEAAALRALGLSFSNLFSYLDGQMDDARICLEMALDAKALGATVLNYTKVTGVIYNTAAKQWLIKWTSRFPDETGESRGSVILDLRGPELMPLTPSVGESTPAALAQAAQSIVLSRGSHLLFDVPWKLPGIALSTGIPGRYYFVWPYFSSYGEYTLVGTTDVYRPAEAHDPIASEEEVSELLGLLQRDLPHSGLSEKTLYQSYCGVRSLVRSHRAGFHAQNFPRTSRKHRWFTGGRYVALVGGKYTSARHTAVEGLQQVLMLLERKPTAAWSASMNRELPGAKGWSEISAAAITKELMQQFGVRETEAAEVVRRRGMSSKKLHTPEYQGASLLQSEVRLAVCDEFALTVEDILRRRLNLSLVPGAGISQLRDVVGGLIAAGRVAQELEDERQCYLRRWVTR